MTEVALGTNIFCTGILPERHFRFVLARNGAIAEEIADRHGASLQVAALLGQTLLGAFFLATHAAKDEERTVSLQLDCEGPLHRVVAFATAAGGLRAAPSRPAATWGGPLEIGKGTGILSVHRWTGENQKVYSSSVEMRDVPLGRNLQEYIGRSDQVQSFVGLESSIEGSELRGSAGYLFQALPGVTPDDIDSVLEIVNRRSPTEVVDSFMPSDEYETRRPGLDTQAVAKILRTGQFFPYCNCSRQKTESMLFLLGRESVMDIVQERGNVEVFCEFCKTRYELSADEAARLFDDDGGPHNG